jgi:dimeric dUTPase (all-alpha-NTP-PPase superfamily)
VEKNQNTKQPLKFESLEDLFKAQAELNELALDKAKASTTFAHIMWQGKEDEVEKTPLGLTNVWLKNYLWALKDEVRELEDEVLNKFWSKDKLDMQNIRVEVVDLWHFLISISQVVGLDAKDLMNLYKQKYEVNVKRQLTNYSKETKHDDNSGIK